MEKFRFQPVQELDLSDYIAFHVELKPLNGSIFKASLH
jgi:hypothetical protein